jgi:adenine-specific DNA-methyltransferase
MTKESRFWEALQDVFIGTPVEGESGYINLMHIKSRYYERDIFPTLKQDIDGALEPFPEFRDELFDKLYSFFHRYFSESGSIYFRYTPLHQEVYTRAYGETGEPTLRPLVTYDQDYEHVYTNEQDVILFWKTQMLYYVKTERLFRSMDVEVEGFRFHFDVSELQHKMANERRELVFEFAERRGDGTLVFTVTYSTYGRKTKLYDIRKALRNTEGKVPNQDILEHVFAIFARQSEVDYFINKDARAFLKEQFDLWMYQYIFSEEASWTSIRIQQLQVLKDIAYKLIDFIAQFEDELVRVWNKPKFVRDSHYIITLDRMAYPEENGDLANRCPSGRRGLLERILHHPHMVDQVAEWQTLGMVGSDFKPSDIWQEDLAGEQLDETYRYLSLDTRLFPDLELEILSLFDHLDEALDGWLVNSENYQALTTLQKKFAGQIKHIYIDPPYNSPSSEIIYENQYKDSSWLSLMSNRLELAKTFLEAEGVLTVAIDDIEVSSLSLLLKDSFREHDLTPVVVVHNPRGNITNNFSQTHEYALFLTPAGKSAIERTERKNKALRRMRRWGQYSEREARPTMFYPIYVKDNEIVHIGTVPDDDYHPESKNILLENGEVEVWPIDAKGVERRWNFSLNSIEENLDRIVVVSEGDDVDLYVSAELTVPKTVWSESKFDAGVFGSNLLNQMLTSDFTFPKSIHTVQESLSIVTRSRPDAVILDFFAGSGTTAHAVMNLNRETGGRRKYIVVEMADYFEDVILPRVKKVAFSDSWKDGQAQPGGQGVSHFAKYYRLEQYEETLRKAHYENAPLFESPYKTPYNQYVFLRDLKLMYATEVETEDDVVHVDLARLYDDIDLAETLSCVTGKAIRRITRDYVEFEDGTRADLQAPDWQLVKPLIWW